jgi:galactokinase
VIAPDDLARAFAATFGRTSRLYRAPGRLNLIGEHTDYNDGFVMPIALDRATWVAAAPRDDRALVVRSREYGETVAIDLADQRGAEAVRKDGRTRSGRSQHWSNYVRGVAAVLGETTPLAGADLLVASDVPIGAGLSSSAALEVACGYALLDLAGADINLTALALACQRAEHEYAGTRCGVMDQMIACYGRADHALMLDTRTLERRWLPMPPGVRVLACNTMVKHELASGEYNARRADCEAGVKALGRRSPAIRALRDATLSDLDTVKGDVPDRVYRRCRHVVTENARVEHAAAALAGGDYAAFGRLMDASHQSLRDDYEVSCGELDTMVAIARGMRDVYGARMTGGGFGGCAVALVDRGAADDAARCIAQRYEAAIGRRPDVWITAAGGGVQQITEWAERAEKISHRDTETRRTFEK